MLLGITGHSYAEGRGCGILKRILKISAIIHINYLPYKFRGMGMTILFGNKASASPWRIAPERQHVIYPQEVHLYQHVLGLFLGKTSAKHMRHHRDVVFVFHGSGKGKGTRPLSYHLLLKQPVGTLAIHRFIAVRGEVDIGRTEFHQPVDG